MVPELGPIESDETLFLGSARSTLSNDTLESLELMKDL